MPLLPPTKTMILNYSRPPKKKERGKKNTQWSKQVGERFHIQLCRRSETENERKLSSTR